MIKAFAFVLALSCLPARAAETMTVAQAEVMTNTLRFRAEKTLGLVQEIPQQFAGLLVLLSYDGPYVDQLSPNPTKTEVAAYLVKKKEKWEAAAKALREELAKKQEDGPAETLDPEPIALKARVIAGLLQDAETADLVVADIAADQAAVEATTDGASGFGQKLIDRKVALFTRLRR